MLEQPMIEKLLSMRLQGMADALKAQEQDPGVRELSFAESSAAQRVPIAFSHWRSLLYPLACWYGKRWSRIRKVRTLRTGRKASAFCEGRRGAAGDVHAQS